MSLYHGDAFKVVRGASGPGARHGERPVFVFQCYLDDSGTTGLPIVTMAGFIADLSQWEIIEPEWDKLLSDYGVKVFHAKEFHDTKPPFLEWSRLKKKKFAEDVFSISHNKIYGLSMTVRKNDIITFKKESGQFQNTSPIGICFAIIITQIVTDPNMHDAVKKNGVAFLIESGNKNNSEFESYFHKMSKNPVYEGVLRSISFIGKSSCRAIQIADFFAFYSRRQMRNHDRFRGKLALPECQFLRIIRSHGPVWQFSGIGDPRPTGKSLNDMSGLSDLRSLRTRVS